MSVDLFIATRIRDLRKGADLSLERLAEASGVSRSMISLIERGETSPTAAVLNKLADALGVTLAALFTQEAEGSVVSPLARRGDQQVWRDPASGYLRRHVSPIGFPSALELVEVTFPAGESVAFENMTRSVETHQQVWILDGEMDITVEAETWSLGAGDCLAMVLGHRIVFTNPTKKPARYLVALVGLPIAARRPA